MAFLLMQTANDNNLVLSLARFFACYLFWSLGQGISYFRRHDYGPAGVRFEKALRDARCIGEGRVEARALGNLATVRFGVHIGCRRRFAERQYLLTSVPV